MARRKSLALAEAIAQRVAAEDSEAAVEPKKRAYASERQSLLGDLGEGRLQNNKIRLVDPARCRMWAGHNRLYDLLDRESCGGLIDSIKALGRQEMPAIVRPVTDDPAHDFEVVCGARRHYSVSWLRKHEHRDDIRFLIDVRNLTDEEAFRVSDAENRDREDISDYERARDYAQALDTYYEGNKKLMAERIGVDRSWLSRYVRIADLPEVVLAAYGDPRRLGIKHASELYPLLSGEGSDAVLGAASRLADEQKARRTAGQDLVEARTVLSRLKAAASTQMAKPKRVSRADEAGKPLFKLEHKQRSVVVTIPRHRLSELEAVFGALTDELRD